MMISRPTYAELTIGLDQLYFLPLGEEETLDDRMHVIEAYIKMSHWTMDEIIDVMAQPEVISTLN